MSRSKDQFIYIKNTDKDGFYKIGGTINLKQRTKAYAADKTCNDSKNIFLLVVKVYNWRDAEAKVKKSCKPFHHDREIYKIALPDLKIKLRSCALESNKEFKNSPDVDTKENLENCNFGHVVEEESDNEDIKSEQKDIDLTCNELEKLADEKGNTTSRFKLINRIVSMTYLFTDINQRHIISLNKIKEQEKEIDSLKREISKYTSASYYYGFSYDHKNIIKCGVYPEGGTGFLDLQFHFHLQSYRTLFPCLKVEFVICSCKNSILVLEEFIEVKFKTSLNLANSEISDSITCSELKSAVMTYLELMGPGKYTIIDQLKIDEYNQNINKI